MLLEFSNPPGLFAHGPCILESVVPVSGKSMFGEASVRLAGLTVRHCRACYFRYGIGVRISARWSKVIADAYLISDAFTLMTG